MKKTLIVSLCTVAFAVAAWAQDPSAAPRQTATTPADATATHHRPRLRPRLRRCRLPGASHRRCGPGAPMTSPAVPGGGNDPRPPVAVAASDRAGQASAVQPTTSEKVTSKNFFISNFQAGGPIMWPILLVSIIALDWS